ncbi:GntR family transcriptional regulator [Prosthecomicrobium sp. N25]|uniref:GntR family transcriptional regulator n=1 Tax=Prosthecomicrobium sp. N25 TaxID=3129254 RepID=UPI00307840DD
MDAVESSKTHRLYLLLKERILSGALAPGERLPGEPSLAAAHGLSRVTVRRALDGLARDGLVTRLPGTGTFVSEPPGRPKVVADLANMFAHLVAMGRATKVKLLSFSYVVPPPAVAAQLHLAPGERTQASLRVRYYEDVPFSYLSTHVPERIGVTYSEADLANRPLLELLERSGVVAARAEQTISATLAGPESAAALGVELGSPLISLTRIVLDQEGRGVEHLSALYRPDQHAFHMELVRAGDGLDRHWRPTTGAPSPAANVNATGSAPAQRPKVRPGRKT